LALAYFAFNFAIGGKPLPATFAAKTAYYAGRSRLGFVTGDVAECFGSGAWLLLAPFALLALGPRALPFPPPPSAGPPLRAGWALALPLAYLALLPYSHRFTRYLVPALPAYAMLAVAGVRAALGSVGATQALRGRARPAFVTLLLAAAAALHARLLIDSDEF